MAGGTGGQRKDELFGWDNVGSVLKGRAPKWMSGSELSECNMKDVEVRNSRVT